MPANSGFNPFAAKESTFGGAAIVPLVTSSICTSQDFIDKQLEELGQTYPHWLFCISTAFWQR